MGWLLFCVLCLLAIYFKVFWSHNAIIVFCYRHKNVATSLVLENRKWKNKLKTYSSVEEITKRRPGAVALWCCGYQYSKTLFNKAWTQRFCTGSNPACDVFEIRNGEDLWQWCQTKIRLNAFLSVNHTTKIIHHYHHHHHHYFKEKTGEVKKCENMAAVIRKY